MVSTGKTAPGAVVQTASGVTSRSSVVRTLSAGRDASPAASVVKRNGVDPHCVVRQEGRRRRRLREQQHVAPAPQGLRHDLCGGLVEGTLAHHEEIAVADERADAGSSECSLQRSVANDRLERELGARRWCDDMQGILVIAVALSPARNRQLQLRGPDHRWRVNLKRDRASDGVRLYDADVQLDRAIPQVNIQAATLESRAIVDHENLVLKQCTGGDRPTRTSYHGQDGLGRARNLADCRALGVAMEVEQTVEFLRHIGQFSEAPADDTGCAAENLDLKAIGETLVALRALDKRRSVTGPCGLLDHSA